MFKFSFSTIFLAALLFEGCSSDLPDPSKDGRNTFGMMVDGAKWENPTIAYSPKAVYYPVEKSLRIESQNRYNDERVVLIMNNLEAAGPRHLDFVIAVPTAIDSTRLLVEDDFENSFVLESDVDSEVTITKFDLSKKIVSGTFVMRLINREGVVRVVTAGRFDLRMAIFD